MTTSGNMSGNLFPSELRMCVYLHSVVLHIVVSDGLKERLRMVTQRDPARVQLGLIGCSGPWRAAVVLVLLLVIVIVDLTGLKTSAEDGRLQPL